MSRRGIRMGYTGGTSATNLNIAQNVVDVAWARNGWEPPWLLRDPDNASNDGGFDPTKLDGFAADISRVHAAGRRYLLSILGTSRQGNSNGGSSDRNGAPGGSGDGIWHHIPTTAPGIAHTVDLNVTMAGYLDPSRDAVELGWNEPNIWNFNHSNIAPGAPIDYEVFGATPEQVAVFMAELIVAIRAAYPTLPIVAGSLANHGDIGNSGNANTGPKWITRMIAADPRLKNVGGDARPTWWGYHPYVGTTSPLNTTAGWAMAQMDAFQKALEDAGVTAPDGTFPKVAVTEYGSKRSVLGDAAQAQWLDEYRQAFDSDTTPARRPRKFWAIGPECVYTLRSDDEALFASTTPFAPFPAGTKFAELADIVEGVVPVLAPRSLSVVSATTDTVAISWTAPPSSSAPIAGYVVYRDGVPVSLQPATDRTFSESGLEDATTYAYTVVAAGEGSAGLSDPAGPLSVTTLPIPVEPPPPTVPRRKPGKRLQVLTADLATGTITGELRFQDFGYEDAISSPGSWDGTLVADGKSPDLLDPGSTTVYAVLGDDLLWGGIQWADAWSGGNPPTLRAGGAGLWSYYREDRRMLRADRTYTATDQFAVVSDLLAYAHGLTRGNPLNLQLRLHPSSGGKAITRTILGSERKNIGALVEELGQADNGFEFLLTVDWDTSSSPPKPAHFLDLWHPRIGRLTPIVWTHGAQITVTAHDRDASKLADTVDAIGGTSSGAKVIRTKSAASGYPRLERAVSFTDVTDTAYLDDQAQAELARTLGPQETLSVELTAAGLEQYPLGSWIPGDEVWISAHDQRSLAVEGSFRVQSYKTRQGPTGQLKVSAELAAGVLLGRPIRSAARRLPDVGAELRGRLDKIDRRT